MTDYELVEGIRLGQSKCLEHLYRIYRPIFIQWAKGKFSLNEDDLIDAFQDTVIAIYNNFSIGKSLQEGVSLKTYLISIGRRKLLDKVEKQGKVVTFSGDWEINPKIRFEMTDETPIGNESEDDGNGRHGPGI